MQSNLHKDVMELRIKNFPSSLSMLFLLACMHRYHRLLVASPMELTTLNKPSNNNNQERRLSCMTGYLGNHYNLLIK